jgi:hypothetical protein
LIDKYCFGATGVANCLAVDAADEAGVTRVSKRASPSGADCDVVTGVYESAADGATYSDVIIAGDDIIAVQPTAVLLLALTRLSRARLPTATFS